MIHYLKNPCPVTKFLLPLVSPNFLSDCSTFLPRKKFHFKHSSIHDHNNVYQQGTQKGPPLFLLDRKPPNDDISNCVEVGEILPAACGAVVATPQPQLQTSSPSKRVVLMYNRGGSVSLRLETRPLSNSSM